MDPRRNPYSPGAGTVPFELAGRDQLLEDAAVALDRICAGRPAKSLILYGLRGVGKTVLLNNIRLQAESRNLLSVWFEASEGQSLPALLIPALRSTLLRLSAGAVMRAGADRALKALTGFAKGLKLKYKDIEVNLDYETEAGLSDSGDLQHDLTQLFETIGQAARERETAVVFYIDEIQCLAEKELASLITALHSASQYELPIAMVAAGFPQILGCMGEARSYAERLFHFTPVRQLEAAAAHLAIAIPAASEDVKIQREALDEIYRQTQGYPYFLQEWGKHVWNLAQTSPISIDVVIAANALAVSGLDQSFFRARFDRLTPSDKRYARAMAEIGAGPYRSQAIAQMLGEEVSSVEQIRSNLIRQGIIFSTAHGDNDFNAPLFDQYMRRTYEWKP